MPNLHPETEKPITEGPQQVHRCDDDNGCPVLAMESYEDFARRIARHAVEREREAAIKRHDQSACSAEIEALRSDISRHVQAAADLANEVAELREMLSDDPHNVPSAFVRFGGVTYRVWGTSSISAFEKMQAQLAELRAENEWLREDAERYRYVRKNPAMLLHLSNEKFDAAIDAARKEGKC